MAQRGRPRKVRLEGDASSIAAAAEAMKKHPNWDKPGYVVTHEELEAGQHGHALLEAVDYFKAKYPEEWAGLALCPLQHGLEHMAGRLKG
jgi:hypothetical protein